MHVECVLDLMHQEEMEKSITIINLVSLFLFESMPSCWHCFLLTTITFKYFWCSLVQWVSLFFPLSSFRFLNCLQAVNFLFVLWFCFKPLHHIFAVLLDYYSCWPVYYNAKQIIWSIWVSTPDIRWSYHLYFWQGWTSPVHVYLVDAADKKRSLKEYRVVGDKIMQS